MKKSIKCKTKTSTFKKLQTPRAIFTDWDDTIFDNSFFCKNAIIEMLCHDIKNIKKSIMPTDPTMSLAESSFNVFRKTIGKPLEHGVQSIFNGKTMPLIKLFKEGYEKSKNKHGLRFLDGSIETLKMLKQTGIPVSVISNKDGNNLRKEIKLAGLSDYFVTVVGEGDTAENKPGTLPMKKAMESFDKSLKTKDCWFIGDSFVDIEFAINTGCLPIVICSEDILNERSKQLITSGKVIHVRNHTELQKIIKSLSIDKSRNVLIKSVVKVKKLAKTKVSIPSDGKKETKKAQDIAKSVIQNKPKKASANKTKKRRMGTMENKTELLDKQAKRKESFGGKVMSVLKKVSLVKLAS